MPALPSTQSTRAAGSAGDRRVDEEDALTAADAAELEALLGELLVIRAERVASTAGARTLCDRVHPNHRDSARNLLHYSPCADATCGRCNCVWRRWGCLRSDARNPTC